MFTSIGMEGYHSRYVSALNYYGKEEILMNDENHTTGLDLMQNIGKPIVLYSLSCDITPFDTYETNSHVWDIEYNIGQSFTVGGKYGGVALLGNTRKGFFDTSATLESCFIQLMKDNMSIGSQEIKSKIQFISRPNFDRHVYFTHNLIGDPEFKIWNSQPLKSNIEIYLDSDNWRHLNFYNCKGYRINISDTLAPIQNDFADTDDFDYIINNSITTIRFDKYQTLPRIYLILANATISGNCTYDVSDVKANGEFNEINNKSYIQINANNMVDLGTLTIKDEANVFINDAIKTEFSGHIRTSGSLTIHSNHTILNKGLIVERGSMLNIK